MTERTKTSKRDQKDLDAARTMKEIPDDLSQELRKMSYEEERRYVREELEAEIRIQRERSRRRSGE